MYLVDRTTGKPPEPTNLFSKEDNKDDKLKKINYKSNAVGDQSSDCASVHPEKSWCEYRKYCQQKAHAQ
jgi:hypothetical protein